jgi:hypothetical protein
LATARPGLGDACDPNPCSASSSLQTPFDKAFSGSTCSPLGGSTCPIAISADITWQGESLAPNGAPNDGTTVFAHCICTAAHGTPAERTRNCQTDATGHPLCRAGVAAMFPFPSPPQASGWRAISTTAPRPMHLPPDPSSVAVRVPIGSLVGAATATTTTPSIGVINAFHQTLYQQSAAPRGRTRWLFDQDATRFGVNYSPPAGGFSSFADLLPATDALAGVGWAFTASLNGATIANPDLASNYFEQDLDPRSTIPLPVLDPPISALPPWKPISPEAGCRGCSSDRFAWITRFVDARINPSDLVAIAPDFAGIIRPNFDAGLLDRFSRVGSGLAFVTPSESSQAVERLLATQRGAFIDAATRQITSVRAATDGSLVSDVLPVSLTTAPAAAAFSSFHGELYAFNGQSGAETLTTVDTRLAKMSQVALTGVSAGTPLSATYRLADDSLYVLDRLGTTSNSPVRIVRVQRSGSSQNLGQISNLGTRTDLRLATTFDDKLLLTAAGQQWDQALYIVLQVSGGAVEVLSSRYESQPGSLLLAPLANRANGLAVATRSGLGRLRFGEVKLGDFIKTSGSSLASAGNLLAARSALDNCPTPVVSSSSSCAPLRSLAVYASRHLQVDDRVRVRTTTSTLALIASGGSTTTNVGTDTQLGNLLSLGDVDLRDRTRLTGFLTTGGKLIPGNSVIIDGAIAQHAPVLPVPLTGFGADFPSSNNGNVSPEPDRSQTLASGAYADVSIKSRSTLYLTSGVYSFRSLSLEPQATLSIDTSAGPIFIYVETGFTFRGAVATRAGSAADLLIAVFGSGTIPIEAPFTGTIVAPNAKLNLASVSGGHTGSFFGLDVEIFPQTVVTFQPFNYPWSP